MKYFAMLIKPASGNCNLNCKYCFYHDVMKYRSEEKINIMDYKTVDSIINKTINFFTEEISITYAFQGGEPTLAGLDYFKYFIKKVNENKQNYHDINYSIQTNGTLLNDEWYTFFKKNNFLVGISIDGIKKINDKYRVHATGDGTYDLIMHNYKKMIDMNIEVNVLTVLTSELSKYPNQLFNFYKKHNIDYIQLIPCLPKFGVKHDQYSLQPEQFAYFYNNFFKCWLTEFKKGNYIHITHFDNLIPMFNGIPPQQCGYLGKCSMQFVTEANGSVYPCDFYVTDEYKAGNINEDDLITLANSINVKKFLNEKKITSKQCVNCEFISICHSQCKRMNNNYFNDNYCGYYDFIKTNYNSLIQVARLIK